MRTVFAAALVAHGLVHLLGVVKAFGFAALPQLTRPIAPALGVVWLAAAVLFAAAAAALFIWPRWWWLIGLAAIIASMAAIVPSWPDARAGATANLVVLAGVVFGFLADGPWSLRAQYERDVDRRLMPPAVPGVVTETDTARLPEPVRRYLRLTGALGQPRVRNFRARMHGRIRSGAEARWMPFVAEQHNFVAPPARLFYMTASMFAIPAQGLHRYVDHAASMQVKAVALVPVVRASGAGMTRAETVTLFNDMCVLAPATLVDPAIAWETLGQGAVRATFTNAGHTIRAELAFNDRGELTDFWSDDRLQTPTDGGTMTPMRWSTPLRDYRAFGAARLASRGEGRWHEPAGDYAYIEIEIDEVRYNVETR